MSSAPLYPRASIYLQVWGVWEVWEECDKAWNECRDCTKKAKNWVARMVIVTLTRQQHASCLLPQLTTQCGYLSSSLAFALYATTAFRLTTMPSTSLMFT